MRDDDRPTIPLERYVAQHGLALTRFAYLVAGDRGRAEDLVQEVYLALYRRFGDALPAELPAGYARTAIVRAQIGHGRRRRFAERPTAELPDRPTPATDPTGADQLWTLLADLSHRQRCVLVLRYRYGCDDQEIAETLGCRRATVRSLAARALADLRANRAVTDLAGEF
ncbi:MAG TPA: sigma-70 family RNA polymerase sigma factor [Jatrophihabitans sp.]|nr:sigma-70 family RNA polymerase sigma factor [Jatrophihabitans sp.]